MYPRSIKCMPAALLSLGSHKFGDYETYHHAVSRMQTRDVVCVFSYFGLQDLYVIMKIIQCLFLQFTKFQVPVQRLKCLMFVYINFEVH
jgi:hypothetical protein